MADPVLDPLFDEDPELAAFNPLAKQQALAGAVRRSPALTMPSSGVVTPKPTAEDTFAQISARIGRRPDEAPLIAQAKAREEESNRNLMAGLALSMKGGEGLAPLGGHLLQQALKQQGGYEIPGGWGTATSQGVTWNPEKQDQADLDRLTRLYGIQEKGESARQASLDRAAYRGQNIDQRNQQQQWHAEDVARGHFDQVTKNTRDVLNEARVVATIPTDGRLSPVQQQSLIVLLNKFQDPGSVVREGEFNRVAAAQGLLQKWGNLPQRLATGQPIPPALVGDIQQVIKAYTGAAENTMRATAADYFANAKQRGLDPTQIVTDRRWHPQQQERPGGSGRGIDAGAQLSASGPSGRRTVVVDD